MEKSIQEQLDDIFDLVDESEGILLSIVKEGHSFTYETDSTIIFQKDKQLYFEILTDVFIELKYDLNQIEKISLEVKCYPKSAEIHLNTNDILVVHIL